MISMTLLGIVGLLVLFVLLALRMPVALSMLGVGFVGTIIANANKFIAIGMSSEQAWGRGWKIAFSNIAGETFEAASNYNLLVIPMFVLMGNLAGVSGLSSDLFNTAYRWLGHLRGGLASATIAACAGFAALSGLILGISGYHGPRGLAANEEAQVRRRPCYRFRRSGRNPWVPHSPLPAG